MRRAVPGPPIERLRRQLRRKDGWIYDDEAFAAAVEHVRAELVDGLLATALRRLDRGRAVRGAVLRPLDPPACRRHLRRRGRRRCAPGTCCSPRAQWHEVQVLKFVHHRFVLDRPDLALHQRGQARLLGTLVEALLAWTAGPARRRPGCPAGCPT